jgi:hypothetical protein
VNSFLVGTVIYVETKAAGWQLTKTSGGRRCWGGSSIVYISQLNRFILWTDNLRVKYLNLTKNKANHPLPWDGQQQLSCTSFHSFHYK